MTMENEAQGQIRKNVYGYLFDMGVRLTEEQTKELSHIMRNIAPKDYCAPSISPVEHLVVCVKCGGSRVHVGHMATKTRKQIRTGEAEAKKIANP